MMKENEYEQKLKEYCVNVSSRCVYPFTMQFHVSSQLFEFIKNNTWLRSQIEEVLLPGERLAKTLIVIKGPISVPVVGNVVIRIVLKHDFPQRAPLVNLEPVPGKFFASVEYLKESEVKIPYLNYWNPTGNPPSSLKGLIPVLVQTFARANPYLVAAAPGIRLPAHPGVVYPVNPGYLIPVIMDEEKRKLILEVKKQFAELSARRSNLVKKQLENIDSVEAIVVVNSMELEEKKTLYQRKMDELSKQKAQLSQLQEYSKKMGKGNYQTLDISNAQTFLHFDTPFQQKYVHLDSKQKALEEAISQIKKLHNSNSIGLIEFLSIVRKLSSKIFLCIFKKSCLETKYRMSLL